MLYTHSSIMSVFNSYPESGLSPKLISPPTPAMYKYRPAFSNNPKVHYHAAAEQVSELQWPATICSQLIPDNVKLRKSESLEGELVVFNQIRSHRCNMDPGQLLIKPGRQAVL